MNGAARQIDGLALRGVLRMLRFDKRGADLIEGSGTTALRSFRLALWLLPIYLGLRWMQTDYYGEAPFLASLAIDLLAYTVLWTAFPLFLWHIAGLLGQKKRAARCITALNWSSVPEILIYLPAFVFIAGFKLAAGPAAWAELAVHAFLLTYQAFIIRHVLGTYWAMAAGMALAGFFLAFQITRSSNLMIASMASG